MSSTLAWAERASGHLPSRRTESSSMSTKTMSGWAGGRAARRKRRSDTASSRRLNAPGKAQSRAPKSASTAKATARPRAFLDRVPVGPGMAAAA
ncbi:MAG: hypothetical protein A2051_01305 [Desulfovibrionales bacterium GWA2_65_9]|nr:MAG: hypothetical protein A2051_01305 [Desulfovibrionales bacterium GWA2_65_9]